MPAPLETGGRRVVIVALTPLLLLAIRLKPHRFPPLITAMFVVVGAERPCVISEPEGRVRLLTGREDPHASERAGAA